MDKTTVTSLVSNYLDCVKLLINEPWPNDLPKILDDVIYNTKQLSEEIKSSQLKSKSDATEKFPSNSAGSRKRSYKMGIKITDAISPVTIKGTKYQNINPVVYIQRLRVENESDDEFKPKRSRAQKNTLDKENQDESKTKNSLKSPDPPSADEGKSNSKKSSGCVIH